MIDTAESLHLQGFSLISQDIVEAASTCCCSHCLSAIVPLRCIPWFILPRSSYATKPPTFHVIDGMGAA